MLFASIGNAQEKTVPFPPIFSYSPVQRVLPTQHYRFNLIDRELKNLITINGDTKTNNLFCASGFIFPNGNERAIVIWMNKSQLYWWWGTTDPQERKESSSLWLAPYSDLKEVAEDGAILGGSTTLNRSQAKSAIEDCEQYGQKFLVSPFTPEPEKTDDDEFELEDIEDIVDTQDLKVAQ